MPDNPTLVIPTAGQATPRPRRTALVAGLLVAAVAVTALALMPDGTGPGLAMATSTTTIPSVETTSTAPETTTTTTTPTTASTIPTTEGVAMEMASHIEELRPPEYRPKDTKRVSDALDAAITAWVDGDEEKVTDELQILGEAIQVLPDTEETDHLTDHFVELVELMGYEIQSDSDEDD